MVSVFPPSLGLLPSSEVRAAGESLGGCSGGPWKPQVEIVKLFALYLLIKSVSLVSILLS